MSLLSTPVTEQKKKKETYSFFSVQSKAGLSSRPRYKIVANHKGYKMNGGLNHPVEFKVSLYKLDSESSKANRKLQNRIRQLLMKHSGTINSNLHFSNLLNPVLLLCILYLHTCYFHPETSRIRAIRNKAMSFPTALKINTFWQ